METKSEKLMQDDGNRRGVQFNPHNKQPANVKRIRMSWGVILLLFVALALAAVAIMLRAPQ